MKKSILETIVPAYPASGGDEAHKPISLGQWFSSRKYAERVNQIRSMPDGKERAALVDSLPTIRPHWAYSQQEGKAFEHSGLACLEILRADNPGLILSAAKDHLSKIENVAIIAINTTADGLLVLVPLAHPENHNGQMISLWNAFDYMGYYVDRLSSLPDSKQPYTADDEIFINEDPKPFAGQVEVNLEKLRRLPFVKESSLTV